MRFLERAIKALGYHRRPYLAGVVVAFFFTLLGVGLMTAAQLNQNTQTGFKNRLDQFDNSALKSANHLIAQVQAAYAEITADYRLWWWVGVAGLAVIAIAFAIGFAHSRRQETTAYLLVGKSPLDIVGQYLLENLVVYVAGFALAMVVAMCFTQVLDSRLTALNLHLLDQHLGDQVSATTFKKITKQLFAHRITDFSGDGLVVPHRGPRPLTTELAGGGRTFIGGALSLLLGQAVVFIASVYWQRRRLRHHE